MDGNTNVKLNQLPEKISDLFGSVNDLPYIKQMTGIGIINGRFGIYNLSETPDALACKMTTGNLFMSDCVKSAFDVLPPDAGIKMSYIVQCPNEACGLEAKI